MALELLGRARGSKQGAAFLVLVLVGNFLGTSFAFAVLLCGWRQKRLRSCHVLFLESFLVGASGSLQHRCEHFGSRR